MLHNLLRGKEVWETSLLTGHGRSERSSAKSLSSSCQEQLEQQQQRIEKLELAENEFQEQPLSWTVVVDCVHAFGVHSSCLSSQPFRCQMLQAQLTAEQEKADMQQHVLEHVAKLQSTESFEGMVYSCNYIKPLLQMCFCQCQQAAALVQEAAAGSD